LTLTPTLTATPRPTNTPTLTRVPPTPTPTQPTRTPTPTPKPTPTPGLQGKIAFEVVHGPGVESDIYIMNADGTNRQKLWPGQDPSLAVNGNKVVFTRYTDAPPDQKGIAQIPFDTYQYQRLTNGSADVQPAWDVGATRVVFVDLNASKMRILAGGAGGRLSDVGPGWYPSFSPNGEWLAYQVGPAGNPGISKIRDYGGDPILLVSDGGKPAWSPDGSHIAYNRLNNIWVVGADGKNERQLTKEPGPNYDPAWSPDGSKIVFVSERDGNAELYVMNADGSNQTRLTNTPEREANPSWSR